MEKHRRHSSKYHRNKIKLAFNGIEDKTEIRNSIGSKFMQDAEYKEAVALNDVKAIFNRIKYVFSENFGSENE